MYSLSLIKRQLALYTIRMVQWNIDETESEGDGWIDPPVRFLSQPAMRLGPRTYTDVQAEFIDRVVRERRPLRVAPLPLDS